MGQSFVVYFHLQRTEDSVALYVFRTLRLQSGFWISSTHYDPALDWSSTVTQSLHNRSQRRPDALIGDIRV